MTLLRSPATPYVAPFALFMALLAVGARISVPPLADQAGRVILLSLCLWLVSRSVIDFRVQRLFFTLALGAGVFVLWIAPDVLFPGYREHWLFSNAITGKARASLDPAALGSAPVLALRVIRAVVLVPMIEELFWRAWLMRWLVSTDFRSVPLGAYSAQAFWVTAVLFASEHGSYWDVGLAAGIVYNWWMLRTGSLGDLMLAHAVTNGCLCAYVLATGKWEYWL